MTGTRQLTSPWPFPVSVLANGQVVRNIPPPKPPLRELAPVRPSNEWQQVDWCPPAKPQA
jgi:hypothetical protein